MSPKPVFQPAVARTRGSRRAPRPPNIVVGGERRVDLLERAMRPLTVIVAPAGAGKTAMLAYWAANRSGPLQWFDGARSDHRLALGRLLTAGAAGQLLVVDDAQELSPAEWQPLVDAVRSGRVRAVLASRRDLPLPVVLLDLSGQLAILRGDRLRLTAEETTELIAAHAPDADRDDVEAVAHRANGWAAAVVLGAHALAAAADRDTARAALVATDQPVLDYLLDEVFTGLPAVTRHVLLCTAHEKRVTRASAQILSGEPEAAALLAQLAVDGMFVAHYDASPDDADGDAEDSGVWVYHPLLLELLHRQVAPGMPDAALALAAHARAARHYAAVDEPQQALRHAVASADVDLAADLLVRLGPRLLATGSREAVDHALGALPVPVRTGRRAAVCVAALERRAAGDADAVLRLVDELASLPAGGEPAAVAPLIAADEAALRLWLARTGVGDLDALVASGLPHLDSAGGDAARLADLGAELAYAQLWSGDVAAAVHQAQPVVSLAAAVGSVRLEAAATSVSAVAELVTGRFQTASTLAERALERLGTPPDESASAAGGEEATLRAVVGWAACYALDLAEARRQLDLARQGLRIGTDPLGSVLVRLLGARVLADEGDVSVARRVIASTVDLTPPPPFISGMLELLRGELALQAGDSSAAVTQVETLQALGWHSEAGLLAAALAVRSHDLPGVRALVAPMLAAGHGAAPRSDSCAAAAAAYELLVALEAGEGAEDEADLRARLRDLLSRCAPQRIVRVALIGMTSPAFLPLMGREATEKEGDPFAAEVLHALLEATAVRQSPRPPFEPGLVPAARTDSSSGPGSPIAVPAARRPPASERPLVPVPALTSREVDVLDRLARGDSYLDIAQTLFITQNTVKTHIASLYRKLNAGRRSEALRTAWALGLLTEVTAATPLPGEPHA